MIFSESANALVRRACVFLVTGADLFTALMKIRNRRVLSNRPKGQLKHGILYVWTGKDRNVYFRISSFDELCFVCM